jgi:DNA modification methylase
MTETCPATLDGKVHLGDSAEMLKCLPDASIDLVITSPPYASARKGYYNSIGADSYKDWFMPIAKEIKRVLKPTGSFALNIKESTIDGTRHPYVIDTVRAMIDDGWKWVDTYDWVKSNPYPITPARKFKDGHEPIYHFTKILNFKFHPDRVKKETNNCSSYKHPNRDGSKEKGGYMYYRNNFAKGDCKTSFPSNVLTIPVGGKMRVAHPARFPAALPKFFIDVMSDKGDTVLDPFAGSGTTLIEAKKSCRKAIGFDLEQEYVNGANKWLSEVDCNS